MATNEILGVRSLTTAIRTFNTKPYDSFFTRLFQQGRQLKPGGRSAEWDEIKSSRGLSPITAPSSPAPRRPSISDNNRDSAMIFTQQSREIAWDRLFLDRHMGELTDNAPAVVMDELEDMNLEIGKTVEYSAAQVMTTGGLVCNSTNIPGSDVTFTLTFTPNTYTKANSWATAGTGIISAEMPAVQANVISASGLPVTRAITNDVTATYLLQNTEVQKFLANQQWAVNFLRANVANGDEDALRGVNIADVTWKVNAYGFNNGSFTRWVANDRVIFLPEDLGSTLAFAEGKVAVPEGVLSSPADLGMSVQRGVTAYAERTISPVGIRLYAVRHFLPILLFPNAVTYATVT